jgi:hypothetical protein
MSPTEPNIVKAFHENSCTELVCFIDGLPLGRATVAKLRDCSGASRRNSLLRFAKVYSGERKEKIGAVCVIHRVKGKARDRFAIHLRWFRTESDPPKDFGGLSDCFDALGKIIGDKESAVSAEFSYDRHTVTSIFSTIQMGSEAGIFDELVGFSGIKRTPEGKLVYKLDVILDEDRIKHSVTFFQTVRIVEELPLILLDIASRISNLGLKKRE